MRRGSTSSGSLHSASAPHRHLSRTIDPRQQLYARADAILAKLRRIPQFDKYEQLARMPVAALPDHLTYSLNVTPPGMPLDPVSVLRRLLRMGAPLTLLYNTVKYTLPATSSKDSIPLEVLSIDDCVDVRKVKKSIYRVCEACANELGMRIDHDLFTISQIFHDGLPEFMAPLNTLELLYQRLGGGGPDPGIGGAVAPSAPAAPGPPAATAGVGSGVGVGGGAPPMPAIPSVLVPPSAPPSAAGGSTAPPSIGGGGGSGGGAVPASPMSTTSTITSASAFTPTSGAAVTGAGASTVPKGGSALTGPPILVSPVRGTAAAAAASRASDSSASTASTGGSSVGSGAGGLNASGASGGDVSRVVDELITTERKYVGDLELLQRFYDEMLVSGIPREVARTIVPCIQRLVEFQQRFLIGCEHQLKLHGTDYAAQDFGWLFLNEIPDFEVYKEYTLAQKEAVQTAHSELASLHALSWIVEPMQGLPMLLLTPVQRIMRYPLLLKSILKHTPSSWPNHANLSRALDAMMEMMVDVNETQRRAENRFVTRELQEKVRDWRGLDLATLGELLLSGAFPVLNSTHLSGGDEQEFYLYLFERALLCCRDRVQTVKKSALTKMRPSASSISSRNSQGKSLSLEIRGRVYMGYVSHVAYSKLQVGGYLLRLAWGHRNDAGEHGAIDIRLPNEEQAQMWEQTIIRLANAAPVAVPASSASASSAASAATAVPASSSAASATPATSASPPSASNRYSFRRSHNSASRRASASSITRVPSEELNFWDDSPSPMDTLRKLSVSSVSSQYSETSRHSMQFASPAAGLSNGGSVSNLRTTRQRSESSISVAAGQRQIRLHVDTDSFIIMVPQEVSYDQFTQKVERKLKLTGKLPHDAHSHRVTLEYLDEDDDRVRLESEEDLSMAFDSVSERDELSVIVRLR